MLNKLDFYIFYRWHPFPGVAFNRAGQAAEFILSLVKGHTNLYRFLLLCILSLCSHQIYGMDINELRQHFYEKPSISISILEALISNQFSVDRDTRTFKFKNYKDAEEESSDIEEVQYLIRYSLESFEKEKKELEKIKSNPNLKLLAMGYVNTDVIRFILHENLKFTWEILRFGEFYFCNTKEVSDAICQSRITLIISIMRSDYDNINLCKENLMKFYTTHNHNFISLEEEIYNFIEHIRAEQASINHFRLYKFINIFGIQLLDF